MRMLLLALLLAATAPTPAVRAQEASELKLTLVNVEYEGTKFWTPGTIVAKKGQKVSLKLVNNVPSDPKEHGFAIPAYKVAVVVNRGEPQTVEFVADTPGVFPIICHLHPAHIGGQLLVLP